MRHRSKKPKVTIFIAALNEEKNIQPIVKECLKLTQYIIEVLVVLDSKTTDNTKEEAEKAGVQVIHTGEWEGKGAALRKAQRYATGDYIVQIDADGQFLPKEIPKLIEPLRHGFDVALGTRFRPKAIIEEGAVTPLRNFGIRFLSLVASLFSKQLITDIPAGFKAFRKDVLEEINIQVNHYGYEAEEVIKAAQKGYKILDVPIHYKKRTIGKSKLVPLKHGIMFLGTIIKVGLKLK